MTTQTIPETTIPEATPADAVPETAPRIPPATWTPARASSIPGAPGPLSVAPGGGSEGHKAVAEIRLASADIRPLPADEAYEPIRDALREHLAGSEEYERLGRLRGQENDARKRKDAAADRVVKLVGERGKAVAQAPAGLAKTLVKLDANITKAKEELTEASRELEAVAPLVQVSTQAVAAALRAKAVEAAAQERASLTARREAAHQEALAALCGATEALTRFAVLDYTLWRLFSPPRDLALEAMARELSEGRDAPPPVRPAADRALPGVSTVGTAAPTA